MRKMRRHVICLIDMVVPLAMQLEREVHSVTEFSHRHIVENLKLNLLYLCVQKVFELSALQFPLGVGVECGRVR